MFFRFFPIVTGNQPAICSFQQFGDGPRTMPRTSQKPAAGDQSYAYREGKRAFPKPNADPL